MSYKISDRPLIEAVDMKTSDLQFEPATVSAAIAAKMVGRVPRVKDEVIKFNVFNEKFIGILEVYFNGCGNWRFTECKNTGNKQLLKMVNSSLPSTQDVKQLLMDIAMLVYRVHLKNKDADDSEWFEGWKLLEHIDSTEVKTFVEANKMATNLVEELER